MSAGYHTEQSFQNILNEHKTLIDYAVWPYRRKFKSASFDEIVCDAEYGLYLAFCRYDPSRGMKFSTFALHIMRQTIIDGFRLKGSRRNALRTTFSIDVIDDLTEPSLRSTETGYQRVEDQEIVAAILNSLDGHSRRLINLRFFDGLKVNEIAERTGLPRRDVSRQINQILRRLAEKFSDDRQPGKSNSG